MSDLRPSWPLFNIPPSSWIPSLTDASIRKLEMVQHRSARMVFSDYRKTSSVKITLHQLQWPCLQKRMAQAKVTMMFRLVNGQLKSPPLTSLQSVQSEDMGFTTLYPSKEPSATRDLSSQTPSGSGIDFPRQLSAVRPSTASRGKRCQ